MINGLFALVTPLGMGLFYLGVRQVAGGNPAVLGSALAFCAGTFPCIACADLLPELQFHSHDRIQLSLALLAGIGVAVPVGRLETSSHAPQPPRADCQRPGRFVRAETAPAADHGPSAHS